MGKEKKSIYEHQKHNEEKEINTNRNAVKDLEEECARDETRWHQTNARMQITQVLDSRLSAIDAREPKSGKQCKTYKELYSTRIKSLTEETDKMRKIQKDVKQMYEPAKEQMSMLADCQRLLQCKRHCLRLSQQDGMNDGGDGNSPGYSAENHIIL